MTILQSESNFLIENFVNDSVQKTGEKKSEIKEKIKRAS